MKLLSAEITRCQGKRFKTDRSIFPHGHTWVECQKRGECLRCIHLGSQTYQTPVAMHLCLFDGEYSEFLPELKPDEVSA